MEKKMDDLIEHTVPENYDEYISNFEDYTDDPVYASPKIRFVKPFKWVDQGSKENYTGGHADKWFARGNVSLFRDLIKELKTNPKSSYETCYTREEIIEDEIPEYFSVLLKKPDSKFEIESDVFVSHIINYFGLPVAYNRRLDKSYPFGYVEHFLVSVDVIRSNEKLVLLDEIVPNISNINISKIEGDGLRDTLDFVGEYLIRYLDSEGIKYSSQDIEDYKKYLASSLLMRRLWLGDYDFRNGNAGILIDVKNKTFRALPNFDMEKSFSSIRPAINYQVLEQFYDYDPEMYDKFIVRMLEFLSEDKKGGSPCQRMADKWIRDDEIKNSMLLSIYSSAGKIWEITTQIKKDREEMEIQGSEKEILS